MRLEGALWQRLRASIHRDRYRIIVAPEVVVVKETKEKGLAEIRLVPVDFKVCIEWRDIQDKFIGVFDDDQNADGAFFVVGGDAEVEAHVVECKITMKLGKWRQVREQLRATLLRLQALAGVLGVTITRVVCYSAYHREELGSETSTEPATVRVPVGDETFLTPDDVERAQILREQYGWLEDTVALRDVRGRHLHRRIRLARRHDDGRNNDVCVGAFPVDEP